MRRCLAKDPEERWQTARDVAAELKWIPEISWSDAADDAQSELSGPRLRERLAWTVAGIASVLLVLAGSGAINRLRTADDISVAVPGARVYRTTLPTAESVQIINSPNAPSLRLALSPDGKMLVFVGRGSDGILQLWVRPLDGLIARALVGTDGSNVMGPFWSTDSRFVAFAADGKLKKIAVDGGPPVTICDVGPYFGGGTWNREDVILIALVVACA